MAGSPVRGGQLAPILRDAGLDVAGMAVATPVAVDPDSPAYVHLAASVASLLPLIVAHDLATEAEVDISTLLDRLRAEGHWQKNGDRHVRSCRLWSKRRVIC